MQRRTFLRLSAAALAFGVPALEALAASGPTTEQGTFIMIHGKRLRVIEVDNRGVWFDPDPSGWYLALQPYSQRVGSKQQTLTRDGNEYRLS